MEKKLILLVILIFCLSNLFNSKINKKQRNLFPQNSFTLEQKEKFNSLLKQGLFLQGLVSGKKPIKKEEIDDENKSSRKLSSEIILEDIGFFNLTQSGNTNYTTTSTKFIMKNVKLEESNFVLYPYPFEYQDQNSEVKQSSNGGIFSFDQKTLKNGDFLKILDISSVSIGQAKSLYDIDIGILSLTSIYEGRETDLFIDSNEFCSYFVTTLNKVSTCVYGKNEYLSYKLSNPKNGAVALINNTDLLNQTLFDETTNNLYFKLLIIPDYIIKNEDNIKDLLTQDGINIIETYLKLGGNIIASGKSGYLLERWGLISSGTYDPSQLLSTNADKASIEGCESIKGNNTNEQSDYFKQLICFTPEKYTTLIQGYVIQKIPNDFDVLMNYTNINNDLSIKKNGYDTDVDDQSKVFPFVLSSKFSSNKGRIFIINGNTISNTEYISPLRNMILYSMTRNLISNIKIILNSENGNLQNENLPIPGGEEGIQLTADFKYYNLFNKDISNLIIDVLLVNNVLFKLDKNLNSNCQLKYDNIYSSYKNMDMDTTSYLRCKLDTFEQFSIFEFQFKMEITSQSVTQKQSNVQLFYPIVSYFDGETSKNVTINNGAFLIQCSLAAILRGTINPDPSGYYPIPGTGVFFDTVLNVENKENTVANEVNFIGIIPLISPIVDGDDEKAVAIMIPPYEPYYKKHNYIYPWINEYNKDEDYIDYVEIGGKDVVYVSDWDTPVKISKVNREDLKTKIEYLFDPLENGNLGAQSDEYANLVKKTNSLFLLKEVYFGDADKFYERATQRELLFIDTTLPNGAKAQYGDKIPDDLIDPNQKNRTKIEFGFCRVDTFFYNSSEYQLPDGLSYKILITVDKYNQDNVTIDGEKFGTKSSIKLVEGHYNSTRNYRDTLKPNEYSNVMRQYSYLTKYDPTNNTDLAELKKITNNTIKLSHYMIPVKFDGLKRASSILYFEEDNEHLGHMIDYPSVKFIYAHSFNVVLKPEKTRIGGVVEIILLNDIKFNTEDPVGKERITISADNVAFYKTVYDNKNKIIKMYFKRGLMPNESYGKNSKCEVYFEGLSGQKNILVTMNIYATKYDFSQKSKETYELIETINNLEGTYKPFWSLPCLYVENKLKRKAEENEEYSSKMLEYELMNPYTRYGTYNQELLKHRTVWGAGECHHRKDPGLQSKSSGFSLLSLVGTSFIPFAEYLSHGSGLLIPGAISTSRLEWTDVWGRNWAQNLRSIYPDIPPVPSPLMSFMMSTTYELLTKDKEERVLEWPSDESVYIHVQMKFINNYFKYFEPVMCLKNQMPYILTSATDVRNPNFIQFTKFELKDKDYDVSLGVSSVYGICYSSENSYLSGQKITSDKYEEMNNMMTCASDNNAKNMSECSKRADELKLPKLNKRPSNATNEDDKSPNKTWNYSPDIESYLPKGYINEKIMWDLTKKDYYDDAFMKAYPFHLDNNLPGLDVFPFVNLHKYKPHNLVAFPIFKGLGYNISYSNKNSLRKYSNYTGWWSDQLQNKDDTLLAGQDHVNNVSVGKDSLINDSQWINARKLVNEVNSTLIETRLKSIYVCKYNQHRVKITAGQTIYSFPNNVFQNNVVPVEPDLEENDERYYNFNCTDQYQYSPNNISQVDNRVYTSNDRDWLYYAINLRGGAKENIHVIMSLDPFSNKKYEGITKIQDGGRFTYWEPPNGPNSFLYVDNNVNTVISSRVDLNIKQMMYPIKLYTFNSDAYQVFSIYDESEENREYTLNTYMNSYGFGDSAVTVYVGGTNSTSCKVEPGSYTIIKITLYNNAGFDWNLQGDAIVFEDSGTSTTISSYQANFGLKQSIQYPTKFNFLELVIPAEIKEYINIQPSSHNVDIAPQFYDFTNNNVITIRDGFEGDYWYKLEIRSNFPNKYKGKLWEIKVNLLEKYFDALPSYNDPTGNYHDYHLKIPSIKFGVPISEGEYKGKVFYYLGQSKNINFSFEIYKYFNIQEIKIVSDQNITQFGTAAGNDKDKFTLLKEIWEGLPKIQNVNNMITIKESEIDTFSKLINVDLSKLYPVLPYEETNSPYVTKINIAFKTYASQVEFGHRYLLQNSKVYYNDGRKNKTQYVLSPTYINCYSSGPWISELTENTVMILNTNTGTFEEAQGSDKILYNNEKRVIKTKVTLKNIGTDKSYRNNFIIYFNKNCELINENNKLGTTMTYTVKEDTEQYIMNINYNKAISVGDKISFDLLFNVLIGNNNKRRRYLSTDVTYNTFEIIPKLSVTMCKVDTQCKVNDTNYAIQTIEPNNKLSYNTLSEEIGTIQLYSEKQGNSGIPKLLLTAKTTISNENYDINDITYIFERKIEGVDSDYVEIVQQKSSIYIDIPFTDEQISNLDSHKVSYKVTALFSNGKTIVNEDTITYDNILNKDNVNDDNSKIPLWGVFTIVIFSLLTFVGAGFGAYKLYKNQKGGLNNENNNNNKEIPQKINDKDFTIGEKSSSRNIINQDPEVKIINFGN